MIDSIFLILPLITVLSIFQTIAGTGMLVLGTPILILIGYEMIQVMTILLPLSILNSLINLIYLNIHSHKIKIDKNIIKTFFLFCFPSIFFGLFFLKKFDYLINFNLLICFVIWIILLFSYLDKKKKIFSQLKFKQFMIAITGFVHGLSNSGGSLLSLFIINTFNKKINYIRLHITFLYFFLALFHYLSIIIIFDLIFVEKINLQNFLFVFMGVILGNLIIDKINYKKFKSFVYLLAFVSSLFLLFKTQFF